MDFCGNLRKVWGLLPYKDKQLLQNLIFPEGIIYNKRTGQCRTTKINSVFLYISQLMRDVAKIKMGESKLIFDIPHWVVPRGVEPPTYGFGNRHSIQLSYETLILHKDIIIRDNVFKYFQGESFF